MNLVNTVRNHPLRLAVGLALAFASWVAYDASNGVRVPQNTPVGPPLDVPHVAELKPPMMQDASQVASTRAPFHPGVVTADQLPRLQLGMARAAVEELIGRPSAGLVHPVAVVEGKFVYRASYLANLDSGADPTAPPRSMIGLDYDAGRPGHPLLRIHIPDPMS